MNLDEREEARRRLGAGEWFGGLPDDLREQILECADLRHFDKGQSLCVEKTSAPAMYVLLDGIVHLVMGDGSGDEGLLHVVEPGFWFMAVSLITGKPPVLTAVAQTPCRALRLRKEQFDLIVEREPRYYPYFARLAVHRFEIVISLLIDANTFNPEARLRRRLAAVARLRQQDDPNVACVMLHMTQTDLARMIGLSRQKLNVLLGKLQRQGLIEVGFRSICVLDADRLEAAGFDLEREDLRDMAQRAQVHQRSADA